MDVSVSLTIDDSKLAISQIQHGMHSWKVAS